MTKKSVLCLVNMIILLVNYIPFSDTVKSENKPQGLYFSKALFEGLIFEGAYVQREICFSKSIGQALFLEGNWPFFFVYFVSEGNFQVQAPPPQVGLYFLGGWFNRVFFRFDFGAAYIWRGIYMEGLIFGILRYLSFWTRV